MNLSDRDIVARVLKLGDVAVMLAAFVLAAGMRQTDMVSFSEFLAMRIKVENFLLLAGFLLLWHTMLRGFGAYEPGVMLQNRASEWGRLANATLLGTLAIGVLAYLDRIEFVDERWLPAFWGMAFGMSILFRWLLCVLVRRVGGTEDDLRHLVIVGTNARAQTLAHKIRANPELGYRLVGFVDDRWAGETQDAGALVSDFDGFPRFLREHVVDEVFICTPLKSMYEWSSRILAQCEQQGITARFVPDVFTPRIGRPRVERFEDHLVVTFQTGGMDGPRVMVKRALDLVVSALLLVALAPVMLGVAVAIRVNSPGPVLFVQERVGLNKRRFRLYKFRTMVVDAEARQAQLEARNEVSGPVFKIKNDPRITPLGAFLRKTSLDELPQLINVLKGDMSLVGPRPLPVRDYRGFTEEWHHRRFSVRPGITCLWQVGGRNSIPFERWMELDMQYIDQWSLMLDLKILLKTVPAVLKGSGAS